MFITLLTHDKNVNGFTIYVIFCERLWVLIAGVCATDGINFTNKSIVVHCHMENGPVV